MDGQHHHTVEMLLSFLIMLSTAYLSLGLEMNWVSPNLVDLNQRIQNVVVVALAVTGAAPNNRSKVAIAYYIATDME